MKRSKNILISQLYIPNLMLFIGFAIAIKILQASLNVWYILAILLGISAIDTIVFYKKSNNSFKPITYENGLETVILSVGITIVLTGIICSFFIWQNNINNLIYAPKDIELSSILKSFFIILSW